MADPKTFGPRLHTYSHADAIDDGVLADYQLVVPTITDTHLRTVLTTPDTYSGFGPTARRTTALHLAVLKAMTEHDLHHVIVYFQQVADATDFACQFPHTLRTLTDDQRPAWTSDLVVQSINGTHSPGQRHDILTDFATADRAVLTNAQVLGRASTCRPSTPSSSLTAPPASAASSRPSAAPCANPHPDRKDRQPRRSRLHPSRRRPHRPPRHPLRSPLARHSSPAPPRPDHRRPRPAPPQNAAWNRAPARSWPAASASTSPSTPTASPVPWT
ncbi:hypothetical protein GCM10020295_82890 [Streptomyces cinereospinus]